MFMLSFVLVVVSMMFLKLVERKIMGKLHMRKGPNMAGFVGLFVAAGDMIKLLSKLPMVPSGVNYVWYNLLVMGLLMAMCGVWFFFPFYCSFNSFMFSFIFVLGGSTFILLLLSVGVHSSKKKYAVLSLVRVVSKFVSYEVGLVMMVTTIMFFSFGWDYNYFSCYLSNMEFFFILIFFCWLMYCLKEVKRQPFDYMEGESELVSGYKVDYGGLYFGCFYVEEYGMIIFLSYMTGVLWM